MGFLYLAVIAAILGAMAALPSILEDVFARFVSLNSESLALVLPNLEDLYNFSLIAGFALFALILSWQAFKSHFSFIGLDKQEEPWTLLLRALLFGFLTFYSRDILVLVIDQLFSPLLNTVQDLSKFNIMSDLSGFIGKSFDRGAKEIFKELILIPILIYMYLVIKFFALAIRFAERFLLTAVMIVFSPMAFACGVSKATSGFFSGFIKVFVSTLFAQMIQIILLAGIVPYVLGNSWSVFGSNDETVTQISMLLLQFIILASMIKAVNSVEEYLREFALSSLLPSAQRGFMSSMQTALLVGNNIYSSLSGMGKSLVGGGGK